MRKDLKIERILSLLVVISFILWAVFALTIVKAKEAQPPEPYVYLSLTGNGNDTTGTVSEKDLPFATLAVAKDALKKDDGSYEGTIFIQNNAAGQRIKITGNDTTLSLSASDNVWVMFAENTVSPGAMFEVDGRGGNSLTLANVRLDGRNFIDADCSAIYMHDNADVFINNGTIIQNFSHSEYGSAVCNVSSNLYMSGTFNWGETQSIRLVGNSTSINSGTSGNVKGLIYVALTGDDWKPNYFLDRIVAQYTSKANTVDAKTYQIIRNDGFKEDKFICGINQSNNTKIVLKPIPIEDVYSFAAVSGGENSKVTNLGFVGYNYAQEHNIKNGFPQDVAIDKYFNYIYKGYSWIKDGIKYTVPSSATPTGPNLTYEYTVNTSDGRSFKVWERPNIDGGSINTDEHYVCYIDYLGQTYIVEFTEITNKLNPRYGENFYTIYKKGDTTKRDVNLPLSEENNIAPLNIYPWAIDATPQLARNEYGRDDIRFTSDPAISWKDGISNFKFLPDALSDDSLFNKDPRNAYPIEKNSDGTWVYSADGLTNAQRLDKMLDYDAEFIWDSGVTKNPALGELIKVEQEFTINGPYLDSEPFDFYASSDNAWIAFVNGKCIGSSASYGMDLGNNGSFGLYDSIDEETLISDMIDKATNFTGNNLNSYEFLNDTIKNYFKNNPKKDYRGRVFGSPPIRYGDWKVIDYFQVPTDIIEIGKNTLTVYAINSRQIIDEPKDTNEDDIGVENYLDFGKITQSTISFDEYLGNNFCSNPAFVAYTLLGKNYEYTPPNQIIIEKSYDEICYQGGTSLSGNSLPRPYFEFNIIQTENDEGVVPLKDSDGNFITKRFDPSNLEFYVDGKLYTPDNSYNYQESGASAGIDTLIYDVPFRTTLYDKDGVYVNSTGYLAPGNYMQRVSSGRHSVYAKDKETGKIYHFALSAIKSHLEIRKTNNGQDNLVKYSNILNAEPTSAIDRATPVIDEYAKYEIAANMPQDEFITLNGYKNGEQSDIKLMQDSLTEYEESKLKNKLQHYISKNNHYEMTYLDLVDYKNGNIVVNANKPITVFYPYPVGTNKNTNFSIFHFANAKRYEIDNNDWRVPENKNYNNYNDFEFVGYELTDLGIKFSVTSFSPFAFIWGDFGYLEIQKQVEQHQKRIYTDDTFSFKIKSIDNEFETSFTITGAQTGNTKRISVPIGSDYSITEKAEIGYKVDSITSSKGGLQNDNVIHNAIVEKEKLTTIVFTNEKLAEGNPDTSDNSDVEVHIIAMLLSSAVLMVLVLSKKYKVKQISQKTYTS